MQHTEREIKGENLRTVHAGYCAFSKITYFLVPESTERFQLVMFLIGASCRRTSSGQDKPKIFFIGAHGQESSVPRHLTLIKMPRNKRIGSPSQSPCGHDSSIFLKSYNESETTSCMQFVTKLYISGLRCLIRDDTNIGKKSDPHQAAQKDKAVTQASQLLYLRARFKHS